jgi:DNA polymerase III subunit beta
MKFTVNINLLRGALNKVVRALPAEAGKAARPIYLSILVQAREGGIVLSAFDGAMWVRAKVDAEVEAQDTCCVPGKLFSDLVRKLEADDLVFEVKGSRVHLTTSDNQCEVGLNDWHQYPVVPPAPTDGFVQIPSGGNTNGGFANALSNCGLVSLTGKPEELTGKIMLTGVYVESDPESNQFRFLSTDGKGAAKVQFSVDAGDEAFPRFAINIPGRIGSEAKALFGTGESISFATNETYLFLESGNCQIISPLIGQYPAKQVMTFFSPKTQVITTVDRMSVIRSLERAKLFATDMDKGVYLLFDPDEQELTLRSAKSAFGQEISSIPATISGEEKLTNRYFLDQVLAMLQNIKTVYVQIEVSAGMTPMILRPVNENDGEMTVDESMVYVSSSLFAKTESEVEEAAAKTKKVEPTKTKAPGRRKKVA